MNKRRFGDIFSCKSQPVEEAVIGRHECRTDFQECVGVERGLREGVILKAAEYVGCNVRSTVHGLELELGNMEL